jgi:hypothetical protein
MKAIVIGAAGMMAVGVAVVAFWPGEPKSVDPVPAPEVAVQAMESAATPRDQVVSVVDLEEEFQKPRPEVEFVAFDPE